MILQLQGLLSSDKTFFSFTCLKANLQILSFNDTFYISSDIFTVEHIQILEQKMERNTTWVFSGSRKSLMKNSLRCVYLAPKLFIIHHIPQLRLVLSSTLPIAKRLRLGKSSSPPFPVP